MLNNGTGRRDRDSDRNSYENGSSSRVETIKEFVRENKSNIIKAAIVLVVGIVAFFTILSPGDKDKGIEVDKGSSAVSEEKEEALPETVIVDISGAVNMPIVIELPVGSRVEDAIKAAGGLKKNADIASINRAAPLEDGQKIYIPKIVKYEDDGGAESATQGGGGSMPGGGTTGGANGTGVRVNINTADAAALETLNGVGLATSAKIIEYRTTVGAFKSIEDIKNVSGIGDKTFEKLKEFITI